MDTLKATLIRELERYTGEAYNCYVFMTNNPEQTRFVVTAVGTIRSKRIVNTSLIVQLVNEKVVIEQDTNSKLLVDALEDAGISRSQIILAYAGESVPETA